VAVTVIVNQAQQGLLAGFRQGWYGCLGRRADGLFELTDALLCAPGPVGSLPQLSLEPGFRRGWGRLYGALAEGEVAAEAIRDLLAARAEWISGMALSPALAAPGAPPRSTCSSKQLPEHEPLGQGGGQDETGVGDRVVVVEADRDRVRPVG
jgi:hypothetical protein